MQIALQRVGQSDESHSDDAEICVGQDRPSHYAALRRRAHYIARAAYYAWVHRSFRHVRWALAAEGVRW